MFGSNIQSLPGLISIIARACVREAAHVSVYACAERVGAHACALVGAGSCTCGCACICMSDLPYWTI